MRSLSSLLLTKACCDDGMNHFMLCQASVWPSWLLKSKTPDHAPLHLSDVLATP